MALIAGKPAHAITFEEGVAIEATVEAMARSDREQQWVAVQPLIAGCVAVAKISHLPLRPLRIRLAAPQVR